MWVVDIDIKVDKDIFEISEMTCMFCNSNL